MKEFSYLKDKIDFDENHKKKLDFHNKYCRYSDIITYKYNRVQLLAPYGFINASWVHMPSINSFIATQGPLEDTIEDFWEMIFTYDVKVIVMLCNLIENNREKCANYWEENNKKYETIKISNEISIEQGLILRRFQIFNKKNYEFKNIVQIHLTTWNDHTAPISNYNKIIKVIKLVDQFKQNSPVVVHCSAGVGRTGTFLSIYNLYHEILGQINSKNTREIKFSIMNLVRKLKEMRMFLVENEEQYIFLYEFVILLLNENNIKSNS